MQCALYVVFDLDWPENAVPVSATLKPYEYYEYVDRNWPPADQSHCDGGHPTGTLLGRLCNDPENRHHWQWRNQAPTRYQ